MIYAQRQECLCSLNTKLTGDGCAVCNPAKSLEYALETIADLEAHRNMLSAELERLRSALEPTYETSPEGRAELDRIQKALDFDA